MTQGQGAWNILVIETDSAAAKRTRQVLDSGTGLWTHEHAASLKAGMERLSSNGVQVVLFSLPVQDPQPLKQLASICRHAPSVPMLAVVPASQEGLGIEAVRHGAEDYLVLEQMDRERLAHAVRYAVERRRLLSELERSRRELQASELNVHEVIQQTADGFVVVDAQSKIALVNPAAERMMGRTAAELLGKPFEHSVAIDKPTEIQISRPGQEARTAEMRVSPILWEGGQGHLVCLWDITERKRVEHMKDEFVSTVSHELRTPLTSIKGAISLFLNKALGEINAEQEDFLKTINGDLDRLAELINTLLDLSKVQAGKMTLSRQRVNLSQIIESVCRSNAGIQEGRKFIRPDTKTPDVLADPGRLIQVISNLLSNAVKFTAPDTGTITFILTEQEDGVAITLQDNGPGIPKEDQWRLFQKFEQVRQSWTERPKGTGLGLAIVREIVDLHQGKITFVSEVGKGTAFTVVLPKFDPAEAFETVFKEALLGANQSQQLCVLLLDVSDGQRRLETEKPGTSAKSLEELETTIRRKLARSDRVFSLEPTLIAVLAATDPEGARALQKRLEGMYLDWTKQVFQTVGPRRLIVASAHYPGEQNDPAALLQVARTKLNKARAATPPAGPSTEAAHG